MLKVFKMNDCDWVAAEDEQSAKLIYQNITGVDMADIDEDFDGEVRLTDTMHWEADEVDPSLGFERVKDSPFGDCYKVPFSWVLENHSHLYPGIIATTEY